MNRRFLLGGTLILAAAAMTGCARVTATTDVKADGSFTRTNVYTQSKANGMDGPQLADTFVMPQGGGWKVTKVVGKDDVKVTSTLNVTPGQALLRDISVRRKGKGPVLVANQVSVAQVAPGRWRYTETFHWNGPAPKELADPDPDMLRQVKEALPADVATDAAARAVAPGIMRSVWSALFGPGESVLPQMFLQPEAAERTLRRRVGKGIQQVLLDKLGSKLTDAERRQTARRMLTGVMAANNKKVSMSGGKESGDDNGSDLPCLSFVLRVPGRLVSTNGETDDLSDEIFWTLYPEAAALGDVTLSAEWETSK